MTCHKIFRITESVKVIFFFKFVKKSACSTFSANLFFVLLVFSIAMFMLMLCLCLMVSAPKLRFEQFQSKLASFNWSFTYKKLRVKLSYFGWFRWNYTWNRDKFDADNHRVHDVHFNPSKSMYPCMYVVRTKIQNRVWN